MPPAFIRAGGLSFARLGPGAIPTAGTSAAERSHVYSRPGPLRAGGRCRKGDSDHPRRHNRGCLCAGRNRLPGKIRVQPTRCRSLFRENASPRLSGHIRAGGPDDRADRICCAHFAATSWRNPTGSATERRIVHLRSEAFCPQRGP